MDDEAQQMILNVLTQAFGPAQAVDICGKYRLAATVAQQQLAERRASEAATDSACRPPDAVQDLRKRASS